MDEGRKMTRLAVDLLREHGPLTIGDLQKLMPREWHNRLTGCPGQWLAQRLRHWGGVYRNSLTKQWYVEKEAPPPPAPDARPPRMLVGDHPLDPRTRTVAVPPDEEADAPPPATGLADADLAALGALCAAAEDPPWAFDPDGEGLFSVQRARDGTREDIPVLLPRARIHTMPDGERFAVGTIGIAPPDAALLVGAVNALPALLAEVDRLRAALAARDAATGAVIDAARRVCAGVDSAATAEANLLRGLDDAMDAYDRRSSRLADARADRDGGARGARGGADMATFVRCDRCGKAEIVGSAGHDRNRVRYAWFRVHDARRGNHGEDIDLCSAECLADWASLTGRESLPNRAMHVINEHAYIDGERHKQWVIDQIARVLLGDGYEAWADEDWDTGIAP